MTWEQLLADIRADLQDESATPKWSTKMLYVYVKDAVRDISIWFPRRVDKLEIDAVNGTFPLPIDYIEDISVECPIGTILERRQTRPGVRYRTVTIPHSYYVSGGNLYVNAPAGVIYLTYNATHPVPMSEADTTFAFTIADVDTELIRLYVKARVFTQMRSRQSSLDRFKPVGQRDDNPLIFETEDLMKEYHQKIQERFPGGVITLYRQGVLK